MLGSLRFSGSDEFEHLSASSMIAPDREAAHAGFG
jgi:hypothetical protein